MSGTVTYRTGNCRRKDCFLHTLDGCDLFYCPFIDPIAGNRHINAVPVLEAVAQRSLGACRAGGDSRHKRDPYKEGCACSRNAPGILLDIPMGNST